MARGTSAAIVGEQVGFSGGEVASCSIGPFHWDRTCASASNTSPCLASISGYSLKSLPSNFAGPCMVTHDGLQLDLATMTMSCHLAPLQVQSVVVADGAVHEQGEPEVHVGHLDTLHSGITSTGFILD